MTKSIITYILFIFSVSSLFAQPDDLRKELREAERSHFSFDKTAFKAAPTPNQRLYDVNYYLLDLDIHPDQFLLEGAVTIKGTSLTNFLDYIDIDFYHTLTVDSIKQNGSHLPVNHQDNRITIVPDEPIGFEESFTVTIYYRITEYAVRTPTKTSILAFLRITMIIDRYRK